MLPEIESLSKEELLLKLLQKEHEYYTSILDITRKEHETLSKHLPLNEIQRLFSQKKALLVNIKEIESALQPLKKYWNTKQERSDHYSVQIHKELSDLDNLLKDILQLDQLSQKMLGNYLPMQQTNSMSS